MPLRLRDATREDMPAIGRVAARAFHPSTDPISAVLFPPHLRSPETPDEDESEAWRRARKALALDGERTNMIVAVDDERGGEIAGFVYWEKPLAGGETGEEGGEGGGKKAVAEVKVSSLDEKAFKEMRSIVGAAEDEVLGKGGIKGTWREFFVPLTFSSCHFSVVTFLTHLAFVRCNLGCMLPSLYLAHETRRSTPCLLKRAAATVGLTYHPSHTTDLEYLGVDPDHQRRGVGRMLLGWGTERADAGDKECYLFGTVAGRPLYEGAGFEVVKEVKVFGAPHYAMLRKPR